MLIILFFEITLFGLICSFFSNAWIWVVWTSEMPSLSIFFDLNNFSKPYLYILARYLTKFPVLGQETKNLRQIVQSYIQGPFSCVYFPHWTHVLRWMVFCLFFTIITSTASFQWVSEQAGNRCLSNVKWTVTNRLKNIKYPFHNYTKNMIVVQKEN